MATPDASTDRSLSIHYLRAVAALMVVLYHVFSYGLLGIERVESVLWLKNGVGIFFVISGFVMVVSTEGKQASPRAFLIRRLRRIVPLYWAMTASAMLILGNYDWALLLRSLLFLPTPAGESMGPLLPVGWTLNYEMVFYLLFALTLPLPRRIAIWSTIGVLAALLLAHDIPLLQQLYGVPVWGDFAAGMLIAHLRIRAPLWCLAGGFVLLALGPTLSLPWITSVTLPSALIVAGARSLDGRLRPWRLPVLLGEASYAIYLAHLFVLLPLIGMSALHDNPPLLLILAVGGSVAVGVAVHQVVEKPLAERLRPSARRGGAGTALSPSAAHRPSTR